MLKQINKQTKKIKKKQRSNLQSSLNFVFFLTVVPKLELT